jgi:hypothetical protein
MPAKGREIVFSKIDTQLNRAQFKRLPETSKNYKIKVNNRLILRSVDNNGFVFSATRKVTLEPKGAFEVIVEYEVNCVFDEKSKQFYNGNIEEIKKFFNKRKYNIYNDLQIGNMSSILISQITLANNQRPIVTPPFISKQN